MVNVRVAPDPSYFAPYIAVLAGTALFSFLVYRTSAGVILFGHSFGGFAPIMDPSERTGWSWIGDATLSAGLLQSPVTGGTTFWLGHAWSLSYEEQFYAVIGVLLAFAQRKWLRTAGILTVTLTAIQVLNPRMMQARGGGFLNGHWQLFALGLALFHWRVRALGATRLLVPIAIVLTAGWSFLQENFGGSSFSTELAAAAIATALMAVLSGHDLAVYRAPVLRGLRRCGERCYSVYLLHWPVTKAITGLALWAGLTARKNQTCACDAQPVAVFNQCPIVYCKPSCLNGDYEARAFQANVDKSLSLDIMDCSWNLATAQHLIHGVPSHRQRQWLRGPP